MTKQKKTIPTVSIGIAAYNEGKNIKNLLHDILRQDRKTWILDAVIVACGGCTDKTTSEGASVSSDKIRLIINPLRQGKAVDEQKIFDECKSDILVMFDADVRLDGTSVVSALVDALLEDKNRLLVGGNSRPYAPKTFFERAVYTTFMSLDACRDGLHGGNNIYGASGQCLAIRTSLIKQIRFPKNIVAEDDFIYFTNKKLGGGFCYVKNAIVYYKLPKKLGDYFRQTLRSDSASASANVETYFGSMVTEEYARPFSFYARVVFRSFLYNPVGTLYMIGVRIVSRIVLPFALRKYTLNWYTAASTK
jgi:glycosyltransferase involved in cell wall biosynthesis